MDALKLPKRAVSFGGVTSSVELPYYFSHASVPSSLRAEKQVSDVSKALIRLSIGLEDVDDLLADLNQAFDVASSAVKFVATSSSLSS